MALPKLNTITYQLTLPSNNQNIVYRPFTVQEEKILLTAQESTNGMDILHAMRQIVNNCSQTPIDAIKLPTFDLEYFFLNIRAKSTGEEIELLLRHPKSKNSKNEPCDHTEKVSILIDQIKVHKPENHKSKFQLDQNIGVQMKYPTFESISTSTSDEFDQLLELIADSIDFIFDKDQIYNSEDATKEEMIKFVYSMNQKQLNIVQEFFDTMPVLKHDVEYVCSKCGCKEKIEIRGFQNFFL